MCIFVCLLQESLKKELLESLYGLPIPDPGMSVYLNMVII